MSEHLCLRCKTATLVELEPLDPRITFFECPECRRHYALKPGQQLTFRWLHPISLALYEVIFDHTPTTKAAAVAASFLERLPAEELQAFVREIQLELDEPTQQVREILDCRASEQNLRDYLRLFCDRLNQSLAAQGS